MTDSWLETSTMILRDLSLLPLWKVSTLLVPPFLAWLYALTCAVFFPYFRDCYWTTHMLSVVPRVSLLLAAMVASMALLRLGDQNDFYVILLSITSTSLSIYFIKDTRISVVEGGPAPQLADMTGNAVLITGSNTGIGKETAIQLAEQGATIILACRSASKGEEAKNDIIEQILQKKGIQKMPCIDVLELDLSSLSSVRKAALRLKEKKVEVNILVLNAGVMMGNKVLTEDGYELTMQANHLGHFLLTRLLLDNGVLKQEGGKVLVLTSSTYSFVDKIDLDDLFCFKGKRRYTLFGQYEMSKLANILFAQELLVRYPKLFTASIHPGLVRTAVVRNMPWYLYYPNIACAVFLWTLQKTPSQGAWCTTHLAAATSAGLESGKYWVNRQVQDVWPCAKDIQGASLLWNHSAKYVGLEK